MNLLKQAWAQIKAQKILSIVSIIGTSLAIFLIMVVVMMQQVRVMPFAPESNRDRLMYSSFGSIKTVESAPYHGNSNGPISYKSAKELFEKMEIPEIVSIYVPFTTTAAISVPGAESTCIDLKETDDRFWKIFDFTFISGKPYSRAAFEAGLPEAVVSESIARRLFGSTDAAGRQMMINLVPYTVSGVAKDVSTIADHAYGTVWVPFTSTNTVDATWNYNLMGGLGAVMLLRDEADCDATKQEFENRMKKYNEQIKDTSWEFISRKRPYTQEEETVAWGANIEPDVKSSRISRLIVYMILLIVPAINLSSMTDSRLRRRTSEIGVRRAFGCRRSELFAGLLGENLIVTLLAGVVGWLLSVVFAWLCGSFLFSEAYSSTFVEPKVDLSMLVQASTFFRALLFCFILNLLSSGIPAWKASRTAVVNALNAK